MAKRGDFVWVSDVKGARPGVVIDVCGAWLFVMIGTGTNRVDLAPACISHLSRDGRRLGLSKDTYFPAANARLVAPSEVVREAGPAGFRTIDRLHEVLQRDGVPEPVSAALASAGLAMPDFAPTLTTPAASTHAAAEPPRE